MRKNVIFERFSFNLASIFPGPVVFPIDKNKSRGQSNLGDSLPVTISIPRGGCKLQHENNERLHCFGGKTKDVEKL